MDQDNDGRVSLAEFKLAVRDSTLERMAQGVWRRLDVAGCGVMSFRVSQVADTPQSPAPIAWVHWSQGLIRSSLHS